MTELCIYPLCKRKAVREELCFLHAVHFAGPKPEKPKKKIAQYSKKRIKQNRELKNIVDDLKLVDPYCSIRSPVCTGRGQGSNHKQKRSPDNLTKKSNLELSCNACNQYCEDHPEWAKENNHFISKFSKAV